ncbi:MAG: SelB C-terminal domain-containing protein [Actinobacteria bacterium]|nr:SelB C-terminal domain-containing protein [Actinomycetota bacterium]
MHVIATAGHVDHGKSTLVLALTGTDPDRWEEEKRRGLTIDLGFAGTTLPSGRRVAFVDVPGHVRFLKNMLAGVGAVDACLFVVAATEGWKPQSEEHLRILEVLGVQHGLVALTKVASVDDDARALARVEVEDRTAGTFLAGARVVEVDAPSGAGVDRLADALDALIARTPPAADVGRPRLWVDRSFAARGSGTVVTGTLSGGTIRSGDTLAVTGPGGAGERVVRVRGLETLGEARSHLGPGHRAAVNLVGVAHGDVVRGDALVEPGRWHRATTVDGTLRVLASLDHPVSRRGAWLAYIGSGEQPVRVRVLGGEAIEPGREGFVRLHLPVALPLLPGDRFVLRDAGRSETVGGGEVLDVAPVVPARRARPDRSPDRVVAERGWVERDVLERLTGERREATVGRWVVSPAERDAAVTRVGAAVDGAGPAGLDLASLDERDRAVVRLLDGVVVERGRARSARQAGADDLARHPWLIALEAAPFSPPPPEGISRADLRRLADLALVVEHDGAWFSATAVAEAERAVARLLATRPDGFTVSEAREMLGTTRKWAVPLLGLLDTRGVTRRRGDRRIAGPRLPR